VIDKDCLVPYQFMYMIDCQEQPWLSGQDAGPLLSEPGFYSCCIMRKSLWLQE